jgi:hypothetical protein
VVGVSAYPIDRSLEAFLATAGSDEIVPLETVRAGDAVRGEADGDLPPSEEAEVRFPIMGGNADGLKTDGGPTR